MPAYLVSPTGHSAPLPEAAAVRVGSGAEAGLRLHGIAGVAPLHFEILPVAGGHGIRRLDSAFPLLLAGQPVEAALLRHGDVITVGTLALAYQKVAPAQAEAPAVEPPVKSTLLFSAVSAPLPKPLEPALPEEEPEESPQEQLRKKRLKEDRFGPGADGRFPRMELLKQAQNMSGAVVVAVFGFIFALPVYGLLHPLAWGWFLGGIILVGAAIGRVIRIIGNGIEPKFGFVAAAACLAAIFSVHLLIVSGMISPSSGDTDSTGFIQVFFGPRALIAYFLMPAVAFGLSFRTLSKEEISELQKPL